MSETFLSQALALLKARLNRVAADKSLDDYFAARLQAACSELKDKGINLDETDQADLMLLVDFAAWNYSSRDKADGYPMWLRIRIRERWIRDPFRMTAGGEAP